jgi:3-hydroxyisobutyrate dehydrogenase-like beta-hydroxyacid dehydrogenase
VRTSFFTKNQAEDRGSQYGAATVRGDPWSRAHARTGVNEMPQLPAVGFVGLGVMGSALSSHLLRAGYEVVGYDIAPDRLAEHTARGGAAAASPAEVAARAGVVVTSLPTARAFADVVRGGDGLAERPAAGLIVVETSTLPIEVKEEARQFLAGRGVVLLDCPLSGTGEQARRGDVVAYLSGDETAKAGAAPVVKAMTRGCHDVGPFGSGSKMKFVANLLVAVHNLAAAEAMLLASRAGLDLGAVLAAVGDGAGTSRMFEVRGPFMAAGNYQPSVRTEVFQKDIEIITAFADQLRAPTPLFSLASVFYRAALAQGRADDDTACVYEVLGQLAPHGTPSAKE